MEIPVRPKKKPTSSKARLINFYNRHHSNSPLQPLRPKPVQETNLPEKVVKTLISPSSFAPKQPITPDLQDSENYPTNENSPTSKASEIPKLLQDLAERTKALDKREAELKLKESSLITKEIKLAQASQELNKNILKLNIKEKKLAEQEEALNAKRLNLTENVTKDLNEKSKELDLQKLGLEALLKNVMEKLLQLNQIKEETNAQRLDCESLDRIEEISEESSFSFNESPSFELSNQKNFILASCQELTQDNHEISSKIDEIMASLNNSSNYF